MLDRDVALLARALEVALVVPNQNEQDDILDDDYEDRGKLPVDRFSQADLESLRASMGGFKFVGTVQESLQFASDVSCACLQIFPRHSSAILAEKNSVNPTKCVVFLVGLLQCIKNNGGRHCNCHLSEASESFSVEISCEFPVQKIGKLLHSISIILPQAEGIFENAKHLVPQGPKFMEMVLLDTIYYMKNPDAGLELNNVTGMKDQRGYDWDCKTDTWPLTKALFCRMIPPTGNHEVLKRKALLAVHLARLDNSIASMCGSSAKQTAVDLKAGVDAAMDLIESVSVEVLTLEKQGYDISGVAAKLTRERVAVEGIVREYSTALASGFEISEEQTGFSAPELSPVACCAISERGEDIEAIRRRAMENVLLIPRINPAGDCRFASILEWVDKVNKVGGGLNASPESAALVMATVEGFVFEKTRLLDPERAWTLAASGVDVGPELRASLRLVQRYQDIVGAWLGREASLPLLYVGIRSREMLVVWAVSCLVHKQAASAIGLLRLFQVPQDWRDLSNLVLDDAHALDAMSRVAKYIQAANRGSAYPGVFHLKNVETTLTFAREFASNDDEIMERWRREERLAKIRKDELWEAVESKQRQVSRLRGEIRDRELELQKERGLVLRAELDKCSLKHWSSAYHEAESRRTSAQGRVSRLEIDVVMKNQQLSDALKPPPFVTNTLPKDQAKGVTILFFWLMPELIAVWSQLTFKAQEALLPRRPWIDPSPDPAINLLQTVGNEIAWTSNVQVTTWAQHYSKFHQGYSDAADRFYQICAQAYKLESSFGPKTVDDYYDPAQGMWYPKFELVFLSPDRRDPYSVKKEWTRAFYTTRLPPPLHALQWVVDHPDDSGGPSIQGNRAYCEHSRDRPEGFTKAGFLALGSIRSFPLRQLRTLHDCLVDDCLPLGHPLVHHVLRQAVYHVGELTSDSEPQMAWKEDLLRHGGLGGIRGVLADHADRIRSSPKHQDSFVILAELACFLSQLEPLEEHRGVAGRFTDVAEGWAGYCEGELRSPSLSVADRNEWMARECLMVAYAIRSMGRGRLTADQARRLATFNVRFHYNLLFTEDMGVATRAKLSAARSHVFDIMSYRADEVWQFLHGDPGALTECLQRVVCWAPAGLSWEPLVEAGGVDGFCFEALDGETHFALNVFTGAVLVDGAPPGRLPMQVLKHPLYVRSFGDRNFEVFPRGPLLVTNTPLRSGGGTYLYHFGLNGRQLCVREEQVEARRTMELLDFLGESASRWWGDLPVRLKDMHSHWAWVRDADEDGSRDVKGGGGVEVVAFRPIPFTEKSIEFFTLSARQCWMVPPHLQGEPLDSILSCVPANEDCLQFVRMTSDRLTRAFAKFELLEYVHVMKDSKQIHVLLPRFQLRFSQLLSGGPYISNEHKGFKLALAQQLAVTLPLFTHYLVLEHLEQVTASEHCFRRRKLLVPVGDVVPQDGVCRVELAKACDADIRLFEYNQHRWTGIFEANSLSSRLHWASILAASSAKLPDEGLRMTGTEAALAEVEKCLTHAPLAREDRRKILELVRFGLPEPWLVVRSCEIAEHAAKMSFLHGQPRAEPGVFKDDPLSEVSRAVARARDACRMVDTRRGFAPCNPVRRCGSQPNGRLRLGDCGTVPKRLPRVSDAEASWSFPVDSSFVREQEDALWSVLQAKGQPVDLGTPCPVDDSTYPLNLASTSKLAKSMDEELRGSWAYHRKLPPQPKVLREAIRPKVEAVQAEVFKALDDAHTALFTLCCPNEVSKMCPRMELLFAANRAPMLTFFDLLRVCIDDSVLPKLHSLLPPRDRDEFRRGARTLLELCVLHDRIERVLMMLLDLEVPDFQIVRELQTRREWDSSQHPCWLVIEVENGLQIRPEQSKIAQYLQEYPNAGSIVQLNMGLGKTRVILPILLADLARKNKGKSLVRVMVLGSMLRETVECLQGVLTASALRMWVSEQPFRRDVDLTPENLDIWSDCATSLKMQGGVQILSPEHWASLLLKREELQYHSKPQDERLLSHLLRELNPLQVLDESDALLHHRFQLVYAMGDVKPLDDGHHRWMAAEALLRVVWHSKRCCEFLDENGMRRMVTKDGQRLPEVFLGEKTTRSLDLQRKFRRILIEEIIKDPPHELEWIKEVCQESEETLRMIVEVTTDAFAVLQDERLGLDIEQRKQVLVLRGYIGFGMLEHALNQRHRVEFGLDSTREKRLAIPFRAADVPDPRSEFLHPDVSLLLTVIAYHNSGLTRPQLVEAVRQMGCQSEESRSYHYGLWFRRAQLTDGIASGDELASIDDFDKVDASNAVQVDLMHRVYKLNTEAVAFWLNHCVFPTDTPEYRERIMASSWDQVDVRGSVGFSGTNDNHRIIPLQVRQADIPVDELRATNGKMLELILDCTVACKVLGPDGPASPLPAQAPKAVGAASSLNEGHRGLLDLCVGEGVQALIDAGSLMAGASNADAARYLVGRLPPALRGVFYFDVGVQGGRWVVLNRSTMTLEASNCTSIQERDAFVFFDDARCRGSDKRLPVSAKAVLTVGFRMCKDKLMQGAGRMRQLGSGLGQKLILVTTRAVQEAIRAVAPAGGRQGASGDEGGREDVRRQTRDIMQWVMANTVEGTEKGLIQWAVQGHFFHLKKASPQANRVTDDWSLEACYKAPPWTGTTESVVAEAFRKMRDGTEGSSGGGGAPALDCLAHQRIDRVVCMWGQEVERAAHEGGEECERENQLEQQQEQEVEKECPKVAPAHEPRWDYGAVVHAEDAASLAGKVGVMRLEDCFAQAHPGLARGLRWNAPGHGAVLCTVNFATTVHPQAGGAEGGLARARLAGQMLVFPRTGEVLLLSEQESEFVLGVAWRHHEVMKPRLVSLATARKWLDGGGGGAAGVVLGLGGSGSTARDGSLADATLAAVQLYNGETQYGTEARRQAVLDLVADASNRGEVCSLLAEREAMGRLEFSALAAVMDRLAMRAQAAQRRSAATGPAEPRA